MITCFYNISRCIVGQSSSKSMATGNNVTNDIVKTGNQLVEELKDTRLNSKDSWNEFKRTGSAAAKRTANALDDHVDTLESQLEKLATDNGKPNLVDSLRGARKDIAKVHSVDRAMNDATGNVNAQDFANQWNKNVPLTGEAKTIADFGNAYKKVSGKVENIGSQGVSKLKFGLATYIFNFTRYFFISISKVCNRFGFPS